MIRKNRDNETLDLMARKMEDDSIVLSAPQQAHFERLHDAYTHWLSNPLLSDNRMRDYMMAMHGISTNQAYRDLALIKLLFGSVALANKEQMRYKANYLYDAAAAAALAGNDKKAKALTKIADGIVKNNRLEDNEGEGLPWEDIVPVDMSLTVDPTVIGIIPEKNIKAKAAKLLKQYTEDIDGPQTIVIPDVEPEEIS
jgi:hypothetical protein